MTEPTPTEDHSVQGILENTAKLIRVGSMIGAMLSEVRAAPMDEEGLQLVREIYERAVTELEGNLEPDTLAELTRLTAHLDDGAPTQSEMRVLQAQLVGWLEGMFQGIQLALMGQRLASSESYSEAGGVNKANPGAAGQYL